MREIKFRAYDELNGEMIYSNKKEDGYLFDLENGIVRCCVEQDTFDVCGDEYIELYDLGNLMQYTGLKDKNGIDIYEGDILSYKHITYTDCSKTEIETIEEESLIEIITYAPIASIVKPHSKNVKCFGYDSVNKECLILDLTSDEVEIVGNIYENQNY